MSIATPVRAAPDCSDYEEVKTSHENGELNNSHEDALKRLQNDINSLGDSIDSIQTVEDKEEVTATINDLKELLAIEFQELGKTTENTVDIHGELDKIKSFAESLARNDETRPKLLAEIDQTRTTLERSAMSHRIVENDRFMIGRLQQECSVKLQGDSENDFRGK